MSDLRKALTRLAHDVPALRPHLVPLLRQGASGMDDDGEIEWDSRVLKKAAGRPRRFSLLFLLVAPGVSTAASWREHGHNSE